jgi:hypothetical protein
MFLVNSCQGRLSAPTSLWDPFSRSYGVKLQSSLTRVLSRALVHLHPNTCVGLRYRLNSDKFRSFSWHPEITGSYPKTCGQHQCNARRIFLSNHLCCTVDQPYSPPSYPNASLHHSLSRCRNINLLSIDYAFQPHLRS